MNKLFFLLIILFASISLEAYAKKIILVSFSTQARADAMMEKLPKLSPSLYTLAKKHDFHVRLKKSGKYYILVAEVFTDKEVLNSALQKIRKSFKGAYVSNYKYPKKKVVAKAKAIIAQVQHEVVKPKVQRVEESIVAKNIEKPTQVLVQKELKIQKQPEIKIEPAKEVMKKLEKVIAPKTIQKKVQEPTGKEEIGQTFLEKHFQWKYVIFLIVGLIGVYYYIKFKRIYDEY